MPCLKCGFTPESPSDQARSILLSDHNTGRATLDAAGAKLQAGETLQFDEPGIAKMAAEMEEIAKRPPPGFGRGCVVFIWLPIGIAFALFALVVGLIWYTRTHAGSSGCTAVPTNQTLRWTGARMDLVIRKLVVGAGQ